MTNICVQGGVIPAPMNELKVKKILVIDDNADVLGMLRDVLTSGGYEVVGLQSTEDIIKEVKAVQPDVVILDYILSGINGGDWCAEIKRYPATQHLPVLLLSAHPKVLGSLGHYGQDAFIEKPFDLDVLLATVAHFAIVA